MSAMTDMSRAIRETIEKHGGTIAEVPDDVLRDLEQIVGAYYLDLRAERERREAS